jgi:hypothetical protein
MLWVVTSKIKEERGGKGVGIPRERDGEFASKVALIQLRTPHCQGSCCRRHATRPKHLLIVHHWHPSRMKHNKNQCSFQHQTCYLYQLTGYKNLRFDSAIL